MSDFERENRQTPGPSKRSGDPIETVLRLTGPRPAVPAARADRVRQAVHAHWRAEVDLRSTRRRFWAVAALATAAMVVAVGGLAVWQRSIPEPIGEIVGRIEAAEGPAEVRSASGGADAAPRALRVGSEVTAGSEITTEGGDRLAIRMASGQSVRLDAGTRLRVVSSRTLALDRGALYVDSRASAFAAGDPLEIRTQLGSVREIGTQFEVRAAAGTVRVRVREGAVAMNHAGGTVDVDAGQEVEIDSQGQLRKGELPPFDAEWGWVGEITPMMEIEGRTLREFLDWAARERGLELRFTGPPLPAGGSEITLRGSIAGMTIDQALESVLPTCHMTHRIEQGVLLAGPETARPGSM